MASSADTILYGAHGFSRRAPAPWAAQSAVEALRFVAGNLGVRALALDDYIDYRDSEDSSLPEPASILRAHGSWFAACTAAGLELI
jgi:hypothetical protein